jgi:hypothetical protein
MLVYQCALPLSRQTLTFAADLLRGSRLSTRHQPTGVLRLLRSAPSHHRRAVSDGADHSHTTNDLDRDR